MKNSIFTVVLILSSFFFESSKAKTNIPLLKISWNILAGVKYIEKEYDEFMVMLVPVFNKDIEALNNKNISISGYILPISKNTYALSRFTFSSCFFCGKAGPESIIGLKFNKSPGFIKTDTYLTIEGTLKLNNQNPEEWVYSCSNAKIVLE